MSTATKKTALVDLEQRKAAVTSVEQRVAELEAQKAKADREAEQAQAALDAYYRAVGAGEREPDQAEERKLHKAADEARSGLAPKLIDNPRAGIGGGRVEMSDTRFDGLLRGAREAVQARQNEYDQFVSQRWDDLVVELTEQATDVQKRHTALWEKALDAEREWRVARRRWEPLVKTGAFTWGDFPESPLREQGALAVPRQLLDDSDRLPRPEGPRTKRRKQTKPRPAPRPQGSRKTRKRAA